MAEVKESNVQQRTGVIGQNRLEMLLFRLPSKQQLYGLNVFKIIEITRCPPITVLPKLHKSVIGVIELRGITASVIDLSFSMGGPRTTDFGNKLLLMTEYNKSIQGFVVGKVERIINLGWDKIKPAPHGVGQKTYLTAVTEFQGELVEIIDVEKILSEISPHKQEIKDESADLKDYLKSILRPNAKILVTDDSKIALKQTISAIKGLGLEVIEAHDGMQALNIIKQYASEGRLDEIELLISDVEMPELDGYSLSSTLRKDPTLKDIYVILQTSISGVFNEGVLKKAGTNGFIAKFDPDSLQKTIVNAIEDLHNGLKPSEAIMDRIIKPEKSAATVYNKSVK